MHGRHLPICKFIVARFDLKVQTLHVLIEIKEQIQYRTQELVSLGVSEQRPRHTKNRRVVFACFSLKFYRLRRWRRRYMVKYQRKACKNDAAVLPLKAWTHQTPPRHFCTLLFEVLLFTDTASVVNSKTSKKSIQKRRGGFWCVKTHQGDFAVASSVNGKTSKISMAHRVVSSLCAMLFFQVLLFTDKNNATTFWCVSALKV